MNPTATNPDGTPIDPTVTSVDTSSNTTPAVTSGTTPVDNSGDNGSVLSDILGSGGLGSVLTGTAQLLGKTAPAKSGTVAPKPATPWTQNPLYLAMAGLAVALVIIIIIKKS